MAQQTKQPPPYQGILNQQDIQQFKRQQMRRLFDQKLRDLGMFTQTVFLYYQIHTTSNIIDSANVENITRFISKLNQIQRECERIERSQSEDGRHTDTYEGLYINNTNNNVYVGIRRNHYIYLFQIGTRIGRIGEFAIQIHFHIPMNVSVCNTEDGSSTSKYIKISPYTFDRERQLK